MLTLGFLAAGNMASAILRGVLTAIARAATIADPQRRFDLLLIRTVLVFDPVLDDARKQDAYLKPLRAILASSNANNVKLEFASSAQDLAQRSHVALVCLKPQYAPAVLPPLSGKWGLSAQPPLPTILAGAIGTQYSEMPQSRAVVISIMAGVPLAIFRDMVCGSGSDSGGCEKIACVRTMPSIAVTALRGSACAAFCPDSQGAHSPNSFERRIVLAIMKSGSSCTVVGEKMIDAVTALSGGGPAYTATFIEALSDAGVAAGLPRPLAHKLATESVLGSAALLVGEKPVIAATSELKNIVTSPGGTTIYGIQALEQGGFRAATMNAVLAATKRSQELKAIAQKQQQPSKL